MNYPLLTVLGEMMGQPAFILQSTESKYGYQEAFGIHFSPHAQNSVLRSATAWYAALNAAQMISILEGCRGADEVESALPKIYGRKN